ncbi:MAG: DUF4921 family protein [Candidatus Sumerlaeaceae bacterium]|nr:DUF4921 family protein [Candidatus Sumerlaeaceae bacterium]
MSTLRKDPLSHGWVIYTDEEYQKPEAPARVVNMPAGGCLYCEKNESMTLPEVAAYRQGGLKNGPGWTVRAVPNAHAVLHIEGKTNRRGEGLYDMMNGIGAHEVIVETPDHSALLHLSSVEKIAEILHMLRDRMNDLMRDPRFRYMQIFRNYGDVAGAVHPHPHSQIIALPIVPRWVYEEINHAQEYWKIKERCVFCDILAQDSDGPRMVYENEGFVALTPFASKFPFETWVYPKEHLNSYHLATDESLLVLADAVKSVLTLLATALEDPPYNLIIHSSPAQPEKRYNTPTAKLNDYYHWHIEIIPRATKVAGFEYGTGFYINSVLPEKAAEILRGQLTPPG